MNLLLVWTLPPQNSFLHKIIDVNLPNFIAIESLQQGVVPGGMKGHEGSKLQIHELGWSVVFVWPWDGNLVLVSTYLQLAWGCTREKKARPPKVKAETWLTPLLHLDLEWRMLHLLKCDCHLFPFRHNFSCSSEREKVEGKQKDALFIWQSVCVHKQYFPNFVHNYIVFGSSKHIMFPKVWGFEDLSTL